MLRGARKSARSRWPQGEAARRYEPVTALGGHVVRGGHRRRALIKAGRAQRAGFANHGLRRREQLHGTYSRSGL